MTTNTAFTKIHAQNVEIFKMVCAQAKTDMSVGEIDHLIGSLFEIKEMKAAANSTDAKRLERMQATKANPAFDTIRARVDATLKQIDPGGINEFAKTRDVKKLDAAIRASGMVDELRFTLKDGLYALGLI
jgi:hypothetical protein